MGRIYCLMGKSAAGKDTVYRALLDRYPAFREIVLYTTRPIRSGERDGVTYHFCGEEEAMALSRAGRVIEMRTYQTVHGPWRYFTADDGQFGSQTDPTPCLLIGTLESYEKLKAYFGSDRVAGIYLYLDDGERLWRALARERAQQEPKYAELCRRFLADEADFSAEKLAGAGIDLQVENDDLAETLARISNWMAENGECPDLTIS